MSAELGDVGWIGRRYHVGQLMGQFVGRFYDDIQQSLGTEERRGCVGVLVKVVSWHQPGCLGT